MNLEFEDFQEENRKQIEKNNRELEILKARLANLSIYVGLLKKLESLQADIRKAFFLIWLMLILFFGVIYS